MARSEARLHLDLWREGLDGHTAAEKLAYCVVLTEPTLNHAGVGAVRTGRWARNASLAVDEFAAAVAGLAAGDPRQARLVVDEDTEEVFVRTLIRRDGVADQPYVLKGAIAAALQTRSPLIRWVLANELRKLPPKRPDGVSKSGKKVVYPDPHQAADLLDPPGSPAPEWRPEPSPDPSDTHREPSPDPLERVSEGSRKGSDLGKRDPSPASPQVSGDPLERVSEGSRKAVEREGGGGRGRGIPSVRSTQVGNARENDHRDDATDGTRIPDDFAPSPDELRWAQRECPAADPAAETEKFADHYRGLAGTDAIRADWHAVWRNWMRRANTRPAGARHLHPVPNDPNRELTDAEVDDILGHEMAPMPPAEVYDQGVDACKAWAREHDPAWRAARRQKAAARLAARAAQ